MQTTTAPIPALWMVLTVAALELIPNWPRGELHGQMTHDQGHRAFTHDAKEDICGGEGLIGPNGPDDHADRDQDKTKNRQPRHVG
jgi:hypothetical protein